MWKTKLQAKIRILEVLAALLCFVICFVLEDEGCYYLALAIYVSL